VATICERHVELMPVKRDDSQRALGLGEASATRRS